MAPQDWSGWMEGVGGGQLRGHPGGVKGGLRKLKESTKKYQKSTNLNELKENY